MSAVKYWKMLPREAVKSTSVEVFEIWWDTVMGNQLKVALLEYGLDQIISSGPFQPQLFCFPVYICIIQAKIGFIVCYV